MYVKRDLFYFNQLFNSSENITWEPQRNPEITIKPFKEYDKPHGPTFLSPTSILGIFQMFFTTELLQIIVTETNRYASLCLKDKFATWEQVTEEELQAYFGFMILTGLVRLPSIRDYWKKSDKFYYKPIASRITRTRFLEIHRFLHFVDNSGLPSYGQPKYSKLQKIKPILEYISDKFENLFIPGQDISIDEAMVKYKGRSSLKQYMPKKPIKRGFKIWMRADAQSGFISKFSVYEGKTANKVEKGLGGKIVENLCENIQGHYHHVYFDNFFTGFDIMLHLLRNGTYANGTLRNNRKGFPTSFKPYLKKGLANRGDHMAVRNGNLAVALWQDTKPICLASTNGDPDKTQDITRKRKDGTRIMIKCPETIVAYNAHMGGVDRNDQLRGYYNVKIKTIKSYKYLFFAAFDVAITNAFIASKFFPQLKEKTLKHFRLRLADLLIGDYNSRKRRGRPSIQPAQKRFCSAHFPVKHSKKGNRCNFCSNYLGRRRETIWFCKDCKKYFCHTGKEDDCFYIYHNNNYALSQ